MAAKSNSRAVWIIGIVIGAIMLVIAFVIGNLGLGIAGGIALAVCLLFLIVSLKTKGALD